MTVLGQLFDIAVERVKGATLGESRASFLLISTLIALSSPFVFPSRHRAEKGLPHSPFFGDPPEKHIPIKGAVNEHRENGFENDEEDVDVL